MDLEELKNNIISSNIEQAISMLREIAEQKSNEAIPLLIEQLKESDNHVLRNQIALTLSDFGCQEAVEPIIEMLSHPKTLGSRGTLLYALEPLDYLTHIDFIVDLLINGNFEVSRQSFILVESAKERISHEVLQRCITKIRKDIIELEDRHDFLLEAVEMISGNDASLI